MSKEDMKRTRYSSMKVSGEALGFTLIEVLFSFVVLGFLTVSIFTLFFTGIKHWQKGIDLSDTQQSARYAMYHMTESIRQSQKDEIELYNPHHIHLGNNEFRLIHRDIRDKTNKPIASNISELIFKKVNVRAKGDYNHLSANDDWNLIKIELVVEKNISRTSTKTYVRPRN